MKQKIIGLSAFLMLFTYENSCANTIEMIDKKYDVKHICIQNNPKVIVDGYLPLLVKAFNEHGISTEVYKNKIPAHCRVMSTYTARYSWDMAQYLGSAEVAVFKDDSRIGYGTYDVSSFNFSKYASVQTKMMPIFNQMLVSYSKSTNTTIDSGIDSKLQEIKTLQEKGLITDKEYKTKRQELINKI